jgi:autotransporter passenger strand-loop-strand repeat protein
MLSGGFQYVSAGATAFATTVDSGGVAVAYGADTPPGGIGGIIANAVVNSGGFVTISRGGTGTDITLDNSGTEVVSSGGIAIRTTVSAGGTIDVAHLSFTSGGSASVNSTSLLTVSVGGHSYAQQLAGSYADLHFVLSAASGGGTAVTAEVVPCFLAGTRILTDRGEATVEDLRVGDLVQTVLGAALVPIIWIGHRQLDCARHPHPREVWPVRIAAGAFGPGRPHTDLFLSPDHAIYLNAVLIPVKHLINGSSIAQVSVDRVTYHHIELAQHDVLLAEGLPAESFLDLRDGANYANRPSPTRLYPDYSARMWEAFGCARLIVTGPELDAAHALVARLAMDQAAA